MSAPDAKSERETGHGRGAGATLSALPPLGTMELSVGQVVRLTMDVRIVPSDEYEVAHAPGVKACAGEVAVVLNTGPVATYLRGRDFEGWLYHHEHDPTEVLASAIENGYAH